jgi:hypothetical protein
VLSAAGTAIAAGGILLGIGLPRDDHAAPRPRETPRASSGRSDRNE